MFSVNQLKIYAETLANKDQTGADFTPDQFNSVLPEEVLKTAETYFGNPKLQPRQPLLTYEKTQAIKDYIANSPLNLTKKINVTDGLFTLPADYLHLSSLGYEYYMKEEVVCIHCGCLKCSCLPQPKGMVKDKKVCRKKRSKKKLVDITIVNNGQWNQLFNDEVVYPTEEYPYGQYYGDNVIEIAPQKIAVVVLRYLRYPKEAKWAYTIPAGTGIAVYDAASSQDIELPRIMLREIACGLLEAMGFHTREYWLERTSQEKIVAGI